MTMLHSFQDNRTGCYANIRMDNGDPVYIGVAMTSVIVKKSKIGFFGPKLYKSRSRHEAAATATALDALYPDHVTPAGMTNPVLCSFTNAALHCSTTAEVKNVLNTAGEKVRR